MLGLVSEFNLVVTNATSFQTNFQGEVARPRYNKVDHLISHWTIEQTYAKFTKTVGWKTNSYRNSSTKYSELYLQQHRY